MPVTYVKKSQNSKTGDCDAVYVTTNSCSKSCPLKNKGCYAENSYVGIIVNRLNKSSKNLTATQIARLESKAIVSAYTDQPKRNLRLHVSGDCKTIEGVKLINNAVKKWKNNSDKIAFSYTHSWDKIFRDQWSNVSMLASIDNVEQATAARENGYACALIVDKHSSNKAYKIEGSDITWLPCPAQTKDKNCMECKICLDADKLFKNNMGVTFESHGSRKNTINKRLKVINNA